jgi:hypothetical protein
MDDHHSGHSFSVDTQTDTRAWLLGFLRMTDTLGYGIGQTFVSTTNKKTMQDS